MRVQVETNKTVINKSINYSEFESRSYFNLKFIKYELNIIILY
jgi:hypothetical protein